MRRDYKRAKDSRADGKSRSVSLMGSEDDEKREAVGRTHALLKQAAFVFHDASEFLLSSDFFGAAEMFCS